MSGRTAVFFVVLGLVLSEGAARADGPSSAVASGSSPAAEQALEVIRRSASGADDPQTEELARQFLVRFPRDPLVPRAELELGRALLARALADSPGDMRIARLAEARTVLDHALVRADVPTALRARIYLGVVAWARNDAEEAVSTLEPIGGAIVDPEDRRLRDSALFEACESLGRLSCALDTLDALRAECRDEADCSDIDARIASLGRSPDASNATIDWVTSADPTRPSWPTLASRAIRVAEPLGEWTSIRRIAALARGANVVLEPDARALAERAERGAIADPKVIGVIAGLSGADAAHAVALVHAIASDAGVPPDDRIDPSAFRFVVRDHRGSPEQAERDVGELVFVARAIAIIGPTDGPSAERAAARAQLLGVPYLSLAAVARSRFVFDATGSSVPASARDEAIRRFGDGLAVVLPRTAHRTDAIDTMVFEHAGGRLDRTTSTRLRSTPARAIYVDARPRELTRLVRSVLELTRPRGRGARTPLVLSRVSYDTLVARGITRELEGAIVLEQRDAETNRISPELARQAFERIRVARAATRDSLADALADAFVASEPSSVAYVVRQGRLVAMP